MAAKFTRTLQQSLGASASEGLAILVAAVAADSARTRDNPGGTMVPMAISTVRGALGLVVTLNMPESVDIPTVLRGFDDVFGRPNPYAPLPESRDTHVVRSLRWGLRKVATLAGRHHVQGGSIVLKFCGTYLVRWVPHKNGARPLGPNDEAPDGCSGVFIKDAEGAAEWDRIAVQALIKSAAFLENAQMRQRVEAMSFSAECDRLGLTAQLEAYRQAPPA